MRGGDWQRWRDTMDQPEVQLFISVSFYYHQGAINGTEDMSESDIVRR